VKNYDLYRSPSIVRVVKSTRLQRGGHVAGLEKTRNEYRILVRKPQSAHLKAQGGGKIK
jgi:hypothetical protein